MANSPTLALQKAVIDLLKGDPDITAFVAQRIYDSAPSLPEFPYITFGPDQCLPVDRGDCVAAWECSLQLDVWSRKPGFPETKAIVAAVTETLDGEDLAVSGFDADLAEISETRVLRDPDGLTSHGVVTIHINIAINGG